MIEEKDLQIDNLYVSYKVSGTGTPVLILHGWGHNSTHWAEIQKRITEKGFKVYIPDLPGFGKTQTPEIPWTIERYKEFIKKFIKEINITDYILISHSFGGRISILLSSENNTIKKQILIGAAGLSSKKSKKLTILNIISRLVSNLMDILKLTSFKRKLSDFYSQLVNSDYKIANAIMRDTLRNVVAYTLFHRVTSINVKTKIIWGELDGITPLESAYYLDKNIKNSELKIIEKANHSPHLYEVEKLTKEIIDFIQ